MNKIIFLMISISFLPISIYFLKLLLFKWVKNYTEKQRQKEINTQKYIQRIQYIKNKNETKEIYNNKLKPYYEEARNLFNQQMKEGKLSHDHIMYLRQIIEEELGEYIHDYDDYTIKRKGKIKKGFDNDCHRIYVYLKSWYISESGWENILGILRNWNTI